MGDWFLPAPVSKVDGWNASCLFRVRESGAGACLGFECFPSLVAQRLRESAFSLERVCVCQRIQRFAVQLARLLCAWQSKYSLPQRTGMAHSWFLKVFPLSLFCAWQMFTNRCHYIKKRYKGWFLVVWCFATLSCAAQVSLIVKDDFELRLL